MHESLLSPLQCPKCGTTNRRQAKFCEECGTSLTLSCPSCGAVVKADKRFCGDCGIPLNSHQAPRQPQNAAISSQWPVINPQSLPPGLQSPVNYTPAHLAQRILASKAIIEGERKLITILFADIKGSMDLMEGMDPEESKRLFDPCIHRMIEAVHRAEGTVTRVLGDGILALFGAPLAIEDHPHRALYAALLMHEAVSRYATELQERHNIPLQIRVGINTGEVVVGAIGTNLFMEYTPVGHAVGLAARMEALATPGSTLVTASTYRLTQEYFRFTPRGSIQIKGMTEPLDVYELLDVKGGQSRLAARSAHGLSPFLGRTQELAYIQELVGHAASG